MVKLGVNIDHIATIRNARGGIEPNPVVAAGICEIAGCDSITVHLREDRRHIKDEDVKILRKTLTTKMNLEMAATEEMLNIALSIKPYSCCIVPEKRQELTTEGGLDVVKNFEYLQNFIAKLNDSNIVVSLFINPTEDQVEASFKAGAQYIELHTGQFANDFNTSNEQLAFNNLKPFGNSIFTTAPFFAPEKHFASLISSVTDVKPELLFNISSIPVCFLGFSVNPL